MSSEFLRPDVAIEKHGLQLPHWQQGEVMVFVTFRLGDSLPAAQVQRWKADSRAWKNANPPPWTAEEEFEYHRRFTRKLEKWLDQGTGSCRLMDSTTRLLLEKVWMRFQGKMVEHHAWVIMPNHVHLLFQPKAPLPKLLQAWKASSAKQFGAGQVWQANYRDTLIRDQLHFINAVRYIRHNPSKACLPQNHFSLWQSDRALAVP